MFRIDEQQIIWRVIDGEVVIVHAETAEYFGTNQSGAVLWVELVQGASGRDDLVEALRARYDLPAAEAAAAVDGFLGAAIDAALVTKEPAAAPPAAVEPVDLPDAPFETPSLVRFGDLDALVLSGE